MLVDCKILEGVSVLRKDFVDILIVVFMNLEDDEVVLEVIECGV